MPFLKQDVVTDYEPLGQVTTLFGVGSFLVATRGSIWLKLFQKY
jgi:hypothetical protein